MSLKNLKRIHRTIGFRITLWYLAIFSLSFLALFSILYLYISSSLIVEDHQLISSKLGELASIYKNKGIEGVREEIEIERGFGQRDRYYVKVSDRQGRTLFLKQPLETKGLEVKNIKEAVSDGLSSLLQKIDTRTYIEVASTTLSDGNLLIVGRSNMERERLLERFRETFGGVVVVVIILGFGGGSIVAFRALMPLRNIINTVKTIHRGRFDARVNVPDTGDELEELSLLFNRMLQRIETLIEGMRSALDYVAHDLRTPITRLRNTAEGAISSDDLKVCHEALADCLEESAEILRMLNDLMEISEAEVGVMRLNMCQIDLSSLIEDVVELYSYVAEEKGVILETDLQAGIIISADAGRLKQAIANIIDNAIKYTPPGGRVMVKNGQKKGYVFVSIKDTGIGIPEEELPRIWDRLYRGKNAVSEKGLGLGLSLVRAVIKAHGGTVKVESKHGKGSVFTLHIPISSL
ncbi:MAG: HAMP domain-containing protein [Nitrospirae bacterium]|nr:HAMP domain-containing protein [Nitrospirota bacterium]